MNKKLYIILISLIFTTKLYSQIGEQRNNLAVGVNVGGINNTVSFNPAIKQSGYNGLTGGFTFRYISEKYFHMLCGAQIELNYSQLGWKEKMDEGSHDSYSRSMNYIQIPFLAHLAFGKEQKGMQIFFNAGPQIGFLLNEKEKISPNFSYGSRTITEQYKKMADKKFDYGIAAGMGMELYTGIGCFLVEGRYYYGLADFYNSTKKDYFSRSANSNICVKVTYLFNLTH